MRYLERTDAGPIETAREVFGCFELYVRRETAYATRERGTC